MMMNTMEVKRTVRATLLKRPTTVVYLSKDKDKYKDKKNNEDHLVEETNHGCVSLQSNGNHRIHTEY